MPLYRVAAAAALIACAWAAPARAQQVNQTIQISTAGDQSPMQFLQPGRQAKTGTGLLRGRVVAGDTGSAVRRAQVRISGADIGTKTALTDAQGRYEFKELPAGRFNLSVSKSGFVTMQFGQKHPFEPGRPIELGEAQQLDKADVALPRGSVLAGRIVDEFGEPVADANVVAMRMQFVNGKRKLTQSGRNSTTNDLGQYRLYGLPPGEYYITATLHTFDSLVMDMLGAAGGPSGSNNNSGYAATYYPGTSNPGEAQRVAVTVGQELPSVDIQLQPVKLAKISGVAVGSDGRPMSGSIVMLMPSARDATALMPGGTSRTNKDGQFTLSGVAPGDYTLEVQSMGAIMSAANDAMATTFVMTTRDGATTSPAGPVDREFAIASVSVAGDDLTGVVLAATHGARATGRLSFGGATAPDGITTMRLMASSIDDSPGMFNAFGGSQVKDDGSFAIDGLVGTRVLRVINAPKGWSLKRVTIQNQDVTDRGFEFKPGEDLSDVTIELTNKTTSITGSLQDDHNQPQTDGTIVIFSQDAQKWTLPTSRWLASARPDQDGHFKVSNLPPGDYYAIAVEYVASGDWQDPDWLANAAKSATAFKLDEGGVKTLDLKLTSQ